MNTNDRKTPSQNKNNQLTEFSLQDLIQILYRRKNTIILSIIIPLILVILYNFFSTPVYESTVTIKKELQSKRGAGDEFRDMILSQTMDELDTEIELIKTWTVLEKVVDELKIYVNIRKIEQSDGEGIDFNEPLIAYKDRSSSGESKGLPQFSNFRIDIEKSSETKEYYIEITESNLYKLYDEESDQVIQSVRLYSTAMFDIDGLHFELKWPEGKIGDKVYFTINNFESTSSSKYGIYGSSSSSLDMEALSLEEKTFAIQTTSSTSGTIYIGNFVDNDYDVWDAGSGVGYYFCFWSDNPPNLYGYVYYNPPSSQSSSSNLAKIENNGHSINKTTDNIYSNISDDADFNEALNIF